MHIVLPVSRQGNYSLQYKAAKERFILSLKKSLTLAEFICICTHRIARELTEQVLLSLVTTFEHSELLQFCFAFCHMSDLQILSYCILLRRVRYGCVGRQ